MGPSSDRPPLSRTGRAFHAWLVLWFPRPFPRTHLLDAALLFTASLHTARRSSLVETAHYVVRALLGAVRDGLAERWGHASRSPMGLAGLWQDVRLGSRRLARSPGYVLVVTVSLAVGIGLNSILFSAVNAFLLRPLEVPRPEELIRIFSPEGRETLASSLSLETVRILDERVPGIRGVAGAARFSAAAQVGEAARVVDGELVTSNYVDVLELRPTHGRGFTEADGLTGGPQTVLLSRAYWQDLRQDGLEPLGMVMRLNEEPFTIIGVMPPGFGGLNFANHVDVWISFAGEEAVGLNLAKSPTRPALSAIGRLTSLGDSPGVEGHINTLVSEQRVGAGMTDPDGRYFVLPERQGLINPDMPRLVSLAAAVSVAASLLVLLVACLNVAGLTLARSLKLTRELGVRMALGAERGRLIRQLLVEGTVLVLPAAVLGVALTALAPTVFSYLLPVLTELDVRFAVDGRTLAFGMTVVGLVVLLAGAVPAVFATGAARTGRIARAGRGATEGGPTRVLRGLVLVEIGFASLVLVIAGLFVQTLAWYNRADPGFETAERVATAIDVGFHDLDEAQGRAFFNELGERLTASPQVTHVAFAAGIARSARGIQVAAPNSARQVESESNVIGPGYFETLGISLVRGRDFSAEDPDGPTTVIVNEAMAKELWPEGTALLELVEVGTPPVTAQVVGVVGDINSGSVLAEPGPMIYLPFSQHYQTRMMAIIASPATASEVVAHVRNQVGQVRSGLPIVRSVTLDDAVNANRMLARAAASVGVALGAVGLLLAALGLFAMLAFMIRTQRAEFGVRQALGATPRQIFRQVVRTGLRLGLPGVFAGLGVGLLVALRVRELAIGSRPLAPGMIASVSLVVLVVLLTAITAPARRAAAVSPVDALTDR